MDQVIMMAMQLAEEFASKSRQQALIEDEALAYHQCLRTVQKSMRLAELQYDSEIKKIEDGEEMAST